MLQGIQSSLSLVCLDNNTRSYNERLSDDIPSDLWEMIYDLAQAIANDCQEAEVTMHVEDILWYIFNETV